MKYLDKLTFNKSTFVEKYVEVGIALVNIIVKPLSSFMKHLLVVKGIDPNTKPGSAFASALTGAYAGEYRSGNNKRNIKAARNMSFKKSKYPQGVSWAVKPLSVDEKENLDTGLKVSIKDALDKLSDFPAEGDTKVSLKNALNTLQNIPVVETLPPSSFENSFVAQSVQEIQKIEDEHAFSAIEEAVKNMEHPTCAEIKPIKKVSKKPAKKSVKKTKTNKRKY